MSKEENIPTINVKLESKIIEGRMTPTSWVIYETPYFINSDKNGTRKIWTKDKVKIILYYLYEITKIKWFIRKYNEQT